MFALLALGVLAGGPASARAGFLTASANSNVVGGGQNRSSTTGPVTATFIDSTTSLFLAEGEANYGMLRATALAQVQSTSSTARTDQYARASATWADTANFGSASSPFNSPLFVTYSYTVTGDLSASATHPNGAIASVRQFHSVSDASTTQLFRRDSEFTLTSGGSGIGDPSAIGKTTVTIVIRNGQSVSLSSTLYAEAYIGVLTPNSAALATVQFDRSLRWGGVSEVRDANGNLVTDYTFVGDSGFNYALPAPGSVNPVPAPPGAVLLAVGGVGLVAVRRLGRRGRAAGA
jgi:hypothetical protein